MVSIPNLCSWIARLKYLVGESSLGPSGLVVSLLRTLFRVNKEGYECVGLHRHFPTRLHGVNRDSFSFNVKRMAVGSSYFESPLSSQYLPIHRRYFLFYLIRL